MKPNKRGPTTQQRPIKLLTFKGSGAFKECYSINRNEVALVPYESQYDAPVDIRDEFKQLNKLKKYKLPVPNARLEVVSYKGKVVEAMILPRFSENFRAGHLGDISQVSKKKLARQMKNILRIVKRHKIYMEDMQFLVNYKTGKVVVADPGMVTVNNHEWYGDCVDDLESGINLLTY